MFIFLFSLFCISKANTEIVKEIIIEGNKRVSEETIKVYGEIEINKDFTETDINKTLNNLYETDFFGEGSIITSTNRSKNVYAMEDCSLLLLEKQLVLDEIRSEIPLVKLVLSHIFNLLELMNQLRFSHLEGVPPEVDDETQQPP